MCLRASRRSRLQPPILRRRFGPCEYKQSMSTTPVIPAPAPQPAYASTEAASVSLAVVKADPEVHVLIRAANENLGVIGYTDHGFRHAEIVARDARVILRRTGYSRREQDLAAVSGYLHDIGNVVG